LGVAGRVWLRRGFSPNADILTLVAGGFCSVFRQPRSDAFSAFTDKAGWHFWAGGGCSQLSRPPALNGEKYSLVWEFYHKSVSLL
jgi:hypothetical protein